MKAPTQFWQGLGAGDSVAVDGVCLTLLEGAGDETVGRFFLQRETLQCTTFGDDEWHSSEPESGGWRSVNIEAALQLQERLSGHLVLGHVHGVAVVDLVQRHEDGSVDVWLQLPDSRPTHLPCPLVMHKGSISLDGVSLTVAQVSEEEGGGGRQRIRVSLIPYTLSHTTLQFWQPGRRVNVEFAFVNAAASSSESRDSPAPTHRSKQELEPMPQWMGLDYCLRGDELERQQREAEEAGQHEADVAFMKEAVALGEKGREMAPPNPWVGCVVVGGFSEGHRIVLGRGYHAEAGQPHAEVQALCNALQVRYPGMSGAEAQSILASVDQENSGRLNFLSGATLYLSLEPCTSFPGKRTPPCDALLSGLGLTRVCVAIVDPDVRVRGRGIERLRAAGLRVDVGIGAELAIRSLAPYLKHRATGIPYVVCKAACSLDGSIAAGDGTSKWITDQSSRDHAHRHLRARSGAIMVGSGTALADDPELTVRSDLSTDRRPLQPLRVLLDSNGRVERGRLLSCDIAPTLVFTTAASLGTAARARWIDAHVEIIELPGEQVPVDRVLQVLGSRGILQVLVEGGALLQSALIRARLVDRLVLYQGGLLLGSTGMPWMRHPLSNSMADITDDRRWRVEHVQMLGAAGMVSEWVPCIDAIADNLGVADNAHSRVDRAVAHLRSGGMVIVTDDADRENEADVVVIASLVSEAQVATMIRHTTGILCAPMSAEHAHRLHLPLMVENNEDTKKTAFTVSCDAVGVTTGVSARDRSLTAHVLASPTAQPSDILRPGHIFPLIEHAGSVHARGGHTEASVALCRLAGIDPPVALIGELINDDGTMSRLDDAKAFARQHGHLPIVSVADLKRALPEPQPPSTSSHAKSGTPAPLGEPAIIQLARDGLDLGDWTVQIYRTQHRPTQRSSISETEVVVLTKGDLSSGAAPPLCRVHSACFTADCLGSVTCDCHVQLVEAMKAIAKEETGILLYMLQHEGRGIGLVNKLKAYALMQKPEWSGNTYDANLALGFAPDERCYEGAAAILHRLGIGSVRLLSNNPAKLTALQAAGVTVTRVALCATPPSARAARYLSDKQTFGNHHPVGAVAASEISHKTLP
ncbi:MAG: bifunctional diaminohydroxyphosphoribosylaminopyrimidine deaminase/5-amino-6-(5-phosphoribosylamino)uracil reductase RibD, partial [archaeon]|nr:bifunctional diaminohydroxyphosphoribosylaminopyrimidine deaminase/5-amino-6-(5-phosphoribosylamino)uracil reductase RibD [archaeon]